jgi:hypothetical protein
MTRRLTLLGALSALLAFTAPAQAQTLWTPISSGTSDTISALVYQSPTRFWYATTNGKIEYFNGTAFVAGAGVTPGENFTGLAFQPTGVPGGPGTSGLYGYAVTSTGHVWQTPNGGVSWTQLAAPATLTDCSTTATATTETELNAVVWASSTSAYLRGNGSTLEKSTAANTATPAFTEINKVGTGTCLVQSDSSSQNLTDGTFLPDNPADGLLVTQDFGTLYGTSNAFASGTRVTDQTVNNFTGNPRIAQDAANPNRLWIVDHEPGGSGCGDLCLIVSTDGGTTSAPAKFSNDETPGVGLYGVSSKGGTEVVAGTGGEIFNSVNGTDFFLNPAAGALRTENWRAEAAYDAAHAAVGGENGALAVTAAANQTTPPKPAPPSGSSATTTSTGGATVTIYKVVFVTGRNARYVPVIVSVKPGRKLVATVLKAKRKLGSGTISFRHKGHGSLHIKLSSKVKPGTYTIVVRVLTPRGKHVGRQLKITFTLK